MVDLRYWGWWEFLPATLWPAYDTLPLTLLNAQWRKTNNLRRNTMKSILIHTKQNFMVFYPFQRFMSEEYGFYVGFPLHSLPIFAPSGEQGIHPMTFAKIWAPDQMKSIRKQARFRRDHTFCVEPIRIGVEWLCRACKLNMSCLVVEYFLNPLYLKFYLSVI